MTKVTLCEVTHGETFYLTEKQVAACVMLDQTQPAVKTYLKPHQKGSPCTCVAWVCTLTGRLSWGWAGSVAYVNR